MSNDFKQPPAAVGEAYLLKARQLSERGERDGAIGILQHLTALEPEFGAAWEDLGVLLAASGRKDEALPCFEKAIQTVHRTPTTLKRHAALCLELGRVEEAARSHERVLSRCPNDVETLLGSAFLRIRLGQFEQAENLVVARLAASPSTHPQRCAFLQTRRASKQPAAIGDGPFSVEVSIIIPSFNNAQYLRRCLDSIYRNSSRGPRRLKWSSSITHPIRKHAIT